MEIFNGKRLGQRNIWVTENWVMENFESRKTFTENFESQIGNLHINGNLMACLLMSTDPKIELSLNLSWNSSLLGAGTNLDLSMISFRGFKFAQILTFPPVFGSKMREPSRGYLGANILADHTQWIFKFFQGMPLSGAGK